MKRPASFSRNGRAKVDGRPAYVLFTNAQLAEIALQRPATRAALKALDGVGEARVRHYADEVLGLVAAAAPPEVPDDSDTTDGA